MLYAKRYIEYLLIEYDITEYIFRSYILLGRKIYNKGLMDKIQTILGLYWFKKLLCSVDSRHASLRNQSNTR